jgi:hypothetical protein
MRSTAFLLSLWGHCIFHSCNTILVQGFRYDVHRRAPALLEMYYMVGETIDQDNKIR